MDNSNIQPISQITDSILAECISRTFKKGFISHNNIIILPEVASKASEVCKAIKNNTVREDGSNSNTIYKLCTYAGIGAVQIWLNNYERFHEENLHSLLTKEYRLYNFNEVIDKSSESQKFLELGQHIRYLCSYIDMRLKGILDGQSDLNKAINIELLICEILFKVGIVYQVSHLCYSTQVNRITTQYCQTGSVNIFADHIGKIYKIVKEINYNQFDNLNFLLRYLPDLEIRQGYELDAFQSGTRRDVIYQLYVCEINSQIRWQPCPDNLSTSQMMDIKPGNVPPYNDSMYIQGLIPFLLSHLVPDPLDYFKVNNTERGAISAWLLHNMHYFMPHSGHYINVLRDYIYDKTSWEQCKTNITSEEIKSSEVLNKLQNINIDQVMPKISFDGHKVSFEYFYWEHKSGLMKATELATIIDGKILFSKPTVDNIVNYESGVRYF